MMFHKKILLPALILLTEMSLFAQLSVAPGSRFPAVKADWLVVPAPRQKPDGETMVLEVVTFTELKMRDAFQTIRFLEEMTRKYRYVKGARIRFRTVVKNSKEELQAAEKKFGSRFTTAIGSDRKDATFNNFSIATVPYTFIGKNGAIAWSGHPVDIEFVLDSLIAGNFDTDSFKTVIKLRKEMQSALRVGLPAVAAATADKVLKLAPNDTIALQTKLYSFEVMGKQDEAIQFLEKHIADNKGKLQPRITLLLLDLLGRSAHTEKWKQTAEKAAKEAVSSEARLSLLVYLTNTARFGSAPLRLMRKLSRRLLPELKSNPRKELYREALLAAARTEYLCASPENAIDLQSQALFLLRGEQSPETAQEAVLLDYYQEALALANEKQEKRP